MLADKNIELDEVEVTTTGFYIYVPNCDTTYNNAIKYGCKSIFKPMDFPHGDRYGGVIDQEGISWWIVTYIEK